MSADNQAPLGQDEELARLLGDDAGTPPAAGEQTPASEQPPADEQTPATEQPAGEQPAGEKPAGEQTPAGEQPAGEQAPAGEQSPAGEQPPAPPAGGIVPLTPEQFREVLESVRQPAAPKEPEPAPQAPPRELTIDDFIADADRPHVENLKNEWGEVHKGVEVLQRAALQHFQHALYTQLDGVLAPMLEQIHALQVMGHFNTIRQAHADYEEVLPKVKEWVDSQPSALKAPLNAVLEKGTAQQIIELLGAYKQATATTNAAPPPASSSAQPPVTTAAPTAAAAAAAAKAPPPPAAVAATAAVKSGSRTAPAESRDPNDFSGALAEALQNL